MKQLFKRAAVCLSLVMTLTLASFTMPSMASADEPSCYGASCDGLDPDQTNCNEDAETLMSRHATTELTGEDIGILELRYSPKCYSNWVRFTPWHGFSTAISNQLAEAEAGGLPWIWRLGVADSLRGEIGRSSNAGFAVTNWTAMVTAEGTTCSSVSLYETEYSTLGGGDRRELGPYNAPCIS